MSLEGVGYVCTRCVNTKDEVSFGFLTCARDASGLVRGKVQRGGGLC